MTGSLLLQQIKSKIREQVDMLRSLSVTPNLATVIVGDNPASTAYLNNQHKACSDVGIRTNQIELAENTNQAELETAIKKLNADDTVTGILLQLPLPVGLVDSAAISLISREKDVDGLNPCNLGMLYQRKPSIVPCTPHGVMVLLRHYGVQVSGMHAVIINRTRLVGRPLMQLMLNEDATVTLCHSKTRNLTDIAKQADILITGIGRRSEFVVGPGMVKPGATVVDVGTSSVGGKLMGDVDFEAVLNVASLVTPVPGGVGPMTIALLLYNTVLTACLQKRLELKLSPSELAGPVST